MADPSVSLFRFSRRVLSSSLLTPSFPSFPRTTHMFVCLSTGGYRPELVAVHRETSKKFNEKFTELARQASWRSVFFFAIGIGSDILFLLFPSDRNMDGLLSPHLPSFHRPSSREGLPPGQERVSATRLSAFLFLSRIADYFPPDSTTLSFTRIPTSRVSSPSSDAPSPPGFRTPKEIIET